ncbi:MAG: TIGR03663 family protein [Bacteriovoracaceae bacterium]|jgi:uncharacterized protein (TIGR03663 family)|nr:TIGR03663 family protein [Bacteriovoracaceae bacterium]
MKKQLSQSNNNEAYNNTFWIIISSLILLGILLRFFHIDLRPFHHDESLNAIYGRYFYHHPTTHYYKYHPMLHGPFLYCVYPFWYQIFGTTISSARIFMATMGSALLFLPYIFRSYLKSNIVLLLTGFLATAPSLIYWARYVRHDSPMLIAISLSLIAFLFKCPWKRALLFIVPFMVQFTIKENAFLHFAILFLYLFYEAIFVKVFKCETETYLTKVLTFCKKNIIPIVVSVLIGAFLFILFFSAFFNYPQGVLDGLYRKSLAYWVEQHNIDRIKGPFIYQILFLSWYEQVFLIAVISQMFHFYMKRSKNIRIIFSTILLISILLNQLIPEARFNSGFLSEVLKLKLPLDIYPFVILMFHAVFSTSILLLEKKNKLALFNYLFTAMFFTYSLVGEKVPWLSLYPIYFGVIFLSFYLSEEVSDFHFYFKTTWMKALIALCFLFQLRMAIMINYSRAGHATELISQVHTSTQYESLLFKLKSKLESKHLPRQHKLLILKENTWPLTWYLYEIPGFYYIQGITPTQDYDYVLSSTQDKTTQDALKETHHLIRTPFRWWWVPPYKTMTFKQWFNYGLNHNPWTVTGTMDVNLYIKKGLTL